VAAFAEIAVISAMGIANEDRGTTALADDVPGFPAIVANVIASIVVVMIVSGG
jgi:hypothetical protein